MNEYWHQSVAKLEEERDQAILFAWSALYSSQIANKAVLAAYENGYADGYSDSDLDSATFLRDFDSYGGSYNDGYNDGYLNGYECAKTGLEPGPRV